MWNVKLYIQTSIFPISQEYIRDNVKLYIYLIIFAISQEYIRDINMKCEAICYAQFTVFSDMMSTFSK